MSKRFLRLLVASVALLVCGGLLQSYAADNPKAAGLEKTTTNAVYRWFTINNCFNWYNNNGRGSYNKITSNSGFEVPKGSDKEAIFEDGVVWGGFHKGRGDPKVGGSTYNQGLQAGKILTPGGPTEAERPVADDPTLAKYRVYRVRPDVRPNTPFTAVKSLLDDESTLISRFENFSAQALYDLYIQDWNEWPANEGPAPYKDVNGNGIYEPAVDIPGQPGADQTLYYVANDLNAANVAGLSGSPPIGLEMHRVVWGYNLTGALGNTIFESTLIINKSGAPLDSAFFVQWSDPDLGTAEDDAAGCDPGRGLGFVYNGLLIDGVYGRGVPAVGYDFFQGPLIPSPGDSGLFRLKYRPDVKNLGMTTFVFFINGNATYTDPNLGAGGDIEWYRLMNARVSSSGAPFVNPLTNQETKFALDGDPVTGQGWLDCTYGLVPDDRRLCLVTGPFTLANGDTQELVVAKLAGFGADRISSVNVLKYYDDLAQSAYNVLFNIPRPPPTPKVKAVASDGAIALSWADSVGSVNIEEFNSEGYAFEGYNVYQFAGPSADITKARRLATYDKIDAITTIFDDVYDEGTGYVFSKPVQFGKDLGLARSYNSRADAYTSQALVNGTPYYFGVTSYSFNPSPTAKPTQLESAPDLLTLVPQSPAPGARLGVAVGDTVKSVQTVSAGGSFSEGLVMPIVLDPTATTGHQYRVNFRDESGTTVWDLTDVTLNKVIIQGNSNQTGDENYPIVDGMLVKVTGPATPGMKDYSIVSGDRHWTWAGANWGSEGFNGAIGNAFDQWFSSSTVDYAGLRNVLIKYAPLSDAGVLTSPSDPNMSFGYRYVRGATAAPAKPEFEPFIINKTAGYAYQDYTKSVPLAAYNTETTPPTRLMVGYLENNASGGLVDGKYAPGSNSNTDNIGATGPREWLYIFSTPYSETPDPALQTDILNQTLPIMWFLTVNRRSGYLAYNAGDEFLIIANHINSPANTFSFTSPAPVTAIDPELAKADVDKVNVYPNPYLGYNTLEPNKYERFITFTHLPAKATIRIFNLAGVLVRTMMKEGGDQFFQWDLRNETGFPVASGMYIAYIDMPDVGKTKTLKLGVILEQQFIDRW